jgi:metal-responsive CopG/Arc/MetJ family transcriptional regulator
MKERITITIEKEFLDWLDKKSDLKIFANRSHGFEFLIKSAQLKDEKENNSSKKKSDDDNEGVQ